MFTVSTEPGGDSEGLSSCLSDKERYVGRVLWPASGVDGILVAENRYPCEDILCNTQLWPRYLRQPKYIKALDNPKIVSRQGWECAQGLYELGMVNSVNLIWVPGHSGQRNPGQWESWLLSPSTAGSEPFIGPAPILTISYSMIESSIGNWAHKQSDVYWELTNTCRQTKMFLEHRSKARWRELLNLPRNLLRTVTGIITGHNTLSRHEHNWPKQWPIVWALRRGAGDFPPLYKPMQLLCNN